MIKKKEDITANFITSLIHQNVGIFQQLACLLYSLSCLVCMYNKTSTLKIKSQLQKSKPKRSKLDMCLFQF